jgi:hypothetical protein
MFEKKEGVNMFFKTFGKKNKKKKK